MHRYRQKRHERNFSKRIKYQCRKTLADSRPRVRGRFARNSDAGAVLPHETKKAQAERAKRRQHPLEDGLLPKEEMYFAGEPHGAQEAAQGRDVLRWQGAWGCGALRGAMHVDCEWDMVWLLGCLGWKPEGPVQGVLCKALLKGAGACLQAGLLAVQRAL